MKRIQPVDKSLKIKELYDLWSKNYDSCVNKTRDLDHYCLKDNFSNHSFESILEPGSGTGKNSSALAGLCKRLTCFDLSLAMLQVARQKTFDPHVNCFISDINKNWPVQSNQFDLVSFNLVLEHIENLNPVFREASRCLQDNGLMYISELHPDRQLIGKTAKFTLADKKFRIPAHVHQLDEYITIAKQNDFKLEQINHQNDADGKQSTARLLILTFSKIGTILR
tara:strand:- start:91 stop:762 length:672 start_codon:yes stop_codon:yes gene_type:complete